MKELCFFFYIFPMIVLGQPNCNIYKYNNDSSCYEGCLLAVKAERFQGSKESQMLFDKAIEMCPNLDYAYREKSVPFLKRGDFKTWKILIDKAVEINPQLHLGARAWCKFQYLKDYDGALKDLEKLDSLGFSDSYSVNGDYHLNIVKGLCFKFKGDFQKAIFIIESQLNKSNYQPKLFDYLHLGILHIQNGTIPKALECFNKQILINDKLAELYYYFGIAYQKLLNKDKSEEHYKKAYELYLNEYRLSDPYTEPIDKVYLDDILIQLHRQ